MGTCSVINYSFQYNCIKSSPQNLKYSLGNDKKTVNGKFKSEEADTEKNKTGKVHSAEYTEAPNAFFTQHPIGVFSGSSHGH
jgi:hypothetical protein